MGIFLEECATSFLGTISCQVTGRRRHSADLPQGGLEVPCTLTFVGQSQDINNVRKLVSLAPAKSIDPPPPKKMNVQVIVEDAQTSEGDTDPKWLKFQGHLLTESDRKAIVSNDLLNDQHINYAQNLLHYQFPAVEGLHDTLFQRNCNKNQLWHPDSTR